MNQALKSITRTPWHLLLTVIVVLSFAANALGVTDPITFKTFQNDSERLVHNAFHCQKETGQFTHSGMLINSVAEDCARAGVYYSQSGLPFLVLGLMNPSNPTAQKVYSHIVKLVLAIITSLMLATAALKLASNLRIRYQLLVLLLLANSTWLVLFAHNLYWLMPLLLAPSWFGWIFYERFQTQRKKFFAILSLLFLLKFLAGYEYISTITVSAICPILYYELKRRADYKKVLRKVLLVFFIAVGSFIIAFCIHWAQVSNQKNSIRGGLNILIERVRVRSAPGIGNVVQGREIIQELRSQKPEDYEFFDRSINLERFSGYSVFDRLVQNGIVLYQYLASPAVNLPLVLRYPYSLVSSIFTFILLIGIFTIKQYKRYRLKFPYKDPLLATTAFALLGALSWLVLGYQHSIIHTHINSIVFYVPFLPLAYIVAARGLQQLVGTHRPQKLANRKAIR